MSVINHIFAIASSVGLTLCFSVTFVCIKIVYITLKLTLLFNNFRSSYSSSENFKFHPFVSDFETNHHFSRTITSPGIHKHECTIYCTLPIVHQPHFYCFTYKSILEYAYYTNLSSINKSLFCKCHTFYNELYHDVFQILKQKLHKVYSIFYIWQSTLTELSVCELHIDRSSVLPVVLDLDIDFQDTHVG